MAVGTVSERSTAQGKQNNTQKAPQQETAHGGSGGFNPFSVPSITELNQGTVPVNIPGSRSAPGSDAAVSTSSGKPKDNTEMQAQLSELEGQSSSIRSGKGSTDPLAETLGQDKENLNTGLQKSTRRATGLGKADGMLSQRIPQQEASIVECERELQEAIENCDMEGEALHRQQLAKKKEVLQELRQKKQEVEQEKTLEVDNNTNIRSGVQVVNRDFQQASTSTTNLSSQFTQVESMMQNVRGTSVNSSPQAQTQTQTQTV